MNTTDREGHVIGILEWALDYIVEILKWSDSMAAKLDVNKQNIMRAINWIIKMKKLYLKVKSIKFLQS